MGITIYMCWPCITQILTSTFHTVQNGVQQVPHSAPQLWPYHFLFVCDPLWSRSPHTHQVNTQLNYSMQIITSYPILHILPNTRITELTFRMLQKVKDSPHLPIHTDIYSKTHHPHVSNLDVQFGRKLYPLTLMPCLLGQQNGNPKTFQTNIWCQTRPKQSLAPTSLGDSGPP